jgi:hypothetical protein
MFWTISCMGSIVVLLGFSYRRLAALAEAGRWAAPFLAHGRGAPSAPSGDARRDMAELNEATIEIGSRLEQSGFVPKSCAKASFFLGALVALMQASQRLGGSAIGAWAEPLLSLAAGCGGALGCWFIGRMAEERARRLREDWNALIRRSARDVATEAGRHGASGSSFPGGATRSLMMRAGGRVD